MICYRDRWFCPFWEDCAKAKDCDRPLTDEVRAQALAAGLPIDQPVERPDCHERVSHDVPYVLKKGGLYYAHNSCGYVSRVLLAELFDRERAENYARQVEDVRAIPITDLLDDPEEIEGYISRLEAMRDAVIREASHADLKIPEHERFVVNDGEIFDPETNNRVEFIKDSAGEIVIHSPTMWCRGAETREFAALFDYACSIAEINSPEASE